jgi:hypothetical protein
MLPYAGTPTARKLAAEGRLGGTAFEPDYSFLDPALDRFYAWMLETFHKRNFTNRGLSHLLRGMIFESRLQSAATAWMTPAETRWLQYICARANRAATTTLRLAVDYFEVTPLADVTVHSGYLAALTQREQAEEATLTRELDAFWGDQARQARRRAGHRARLAGGFEASWTFAEADWETRGIGAA